MTPYRTTYRMAMEKARQSPNIWVEAKTVFDSSLKPACAYLKRTYPEYQWSYALLRDHGVVTCRYLDTTTQKGN